MYLFRADESSGALLFNLKSTLQNKTEMKKEIGFRAIRGESVTQIAKEKKVSRKFVYTQKNMALKAIEKAFSNNLDVKLKDVLFTFSFTKAIIEQLVLSMILCGRSSYRSTQRILLDIFNFNISLGKISTIVKKSSQTAAIVNNYRDLSDIKVACHDEVFFNGKPIFTAVEPISRFCFLMKEAEACSEIEWEATLQEKVAQGYEPEYIVADGGAPLRSGIKKALPGVPCFYDVFHLSREFGKAILGFKQSLSKNSKSLESLTERIEEDGLSQNDPRNKDDFTSLNWLTESVNFELKAIECLGKGIGRTIHKALSFTKSYTFTEREDFYDRTLQSLNPIVASPFNRKFHTDRLYSLLYTQKKNLLSIFNLSSSLPKIRASSAVENFHFNLRQQLQGQAFFDGPHQQLQLFYLNHRRFLASKHPHRRQRSPAEVLDQRSHPHWLEMLGYEKPPFMSVT